MDRSELYKSNEKGGKYYISVTEIKELYISLDRPYVRCVISERKAFITFKGLDRLQFIVDSISSKDQLSFFEKSEIILLDSYNQSFFKFILVELFQGNKLGQRLNRFLQFGIVCFVFNILILVFASEKNITLVFSSLLTGVSVFIAIFSVFTANQSYFKKNKIELFKKGKISYYYSVDRNMTISGLITILFCLFGLILVKDDAMSDFKFDGFEFSLEAAVTRKSMILWIVNIAFLLTFVTLRSLVEFYIKRPAKFHVGEMKDEFLENS